MRCPSKMGHLFLGVLACLTCLSLSDCLQFQDYFKESTYEKVSNRTFYFASYYDDHMVLQMAPAKSTLWGYAPLTAVGQKVTVYLMGNSKKQRYSTTVRKGPFPLSAVWSVQLDPVTSGGPYQISAVLDRQHTIQINDVLFGDVWLCSGQSNMQFAVDQMFGKQYEYTVAPAYKNIRLFNVQRVKSVKPLYDLQKIITTWTAPDLVAFNGGWNGFSAVCYMYGKNLYDNLKYPIGLIDSSWGGTGVEVWSSPEALAKCGLDETPQSDGPWQPNRDPQYSFQTRDTPELMEDDVLTGGNSINFPTRDSILWNAMIHPFLNMTIKGVIWYQGETNVAINMNLYNCTFPAMIQDWRNKFYQGTEGQVSQDMPFGFVQIGPNKDVPTQFGYPTLRWHQMADNVKSLPFSNMFMAVAMDLTDNESPYISVHIRDKKTVAERLSRAALNAIYWKRPDTESYPYPTREQILPKTRELLVQFGNNVIQINVHIKEGFEVCCASDYSECPIDSAVNWVASPIVWNNVTTILLSWKKCQNATIAAYRYAWRATPCSYRQCAIYSDFSGDPLPTFTRPLTKEMSFDTPRGSNSNWDK